MTSEKMLNQLADDFIAAVRKKADDRYIGWEDESAKYAYMAGYFETVIKRMITDSNFESAASLARRDLEVMKK